MLRRTTAASAGLILSLLGVLPAGAALSTGCELSVAPAQTEPDAPVAATYQRDITVANAGTKTCSVDFALTQMLHDLDGTPKYVASNKVSSAFSISKTSASVAPGAKTVVTLSGAIPAGEKSMYVAVISTYRAAGQTQGSSVAIRTQIASQFLLRGAKPWDETAKLVDVGFMPGGTAKKRQVYGIVRNDGNVHVRPITVVTIFDKGKKIATVKLEKDRDPPPAIFPKLSRRMLGTWLPKGPVSNEVTLQGTTVGPGGTSTAKRVVRFSAQGLAIVKAATLQLSARVEGKPVVTALVKNTGTQILNAALVTIVATQDGKFERAREKIPLAPLQPSKSQTVTWTQDLPKGAYAVVATVEDQSQKLDEKRTGFVIGPPPASKKSRGLLLYLAIGLVVLAGSGSLFGLKRVKMAHAA